MEVALRVYVNRLDGGEIWLTSLDRTIARGWPETRGFLVVALVAISGEPCKPYVIIQWAGHDVRPRTPY